MLYRQEPLNLVQVAPGPGLSSRELDVIEFDVLMTPVYDLM